MAGRARSNATRCPFVKKDGLPCGRIVPPRWDVCVTHAEELGRQILLESPERVEVTVQLPKFVATLGGLSRSQWEAVRLELCGVPVGEGFYD